MLGYETRLTIIPPGPIWARQKWSWNTTYKLEHWYSTCQVKWQIYEAKDMDWGKRRLLSIQWYCWVADVLLRTPETKFTTLQRTRTVKDLLLTIVWSYGFCSEFFVSRVQNEISRSSIRCMQAWQELRIVCSFRGSALGKRSYRDLTYRTGWFWWCSEFNYRAYVTRSWLEWFEGLLEEEIKRIAKHLDS